MITSVQPKAVAQPPQSGESGRTLLPKADIYETENAFKLIVNLPGVSEDDIEIAVDNNVLTIDAKVSKEDLDGFDPVYTEFALANYRRQFSISETIDIETITAELKDGTLRLTLPKHAIHKPKTIKVHAV